MAIVPDTSNIPQKGIVITHLSPHTTRKALQSMHSPPFGKIQEASGHPADHINTRDVGSLMPESEAGSPAHAQDDRASSRGVALV